MGSTENIKLCDFTSHNNQDFICTPIATPATSATSYEIKPALLNLVMRDNSLVLEMMLLYTWIILLNYVICNKEVEGDVVKLKLFSFLFEGRS